MSRSKRENAEDEERITPLHMCDVRCAVCVRGRSHSVVRSTPTPPPPRGLRHPQYTFTLAEGMCPPPPRPPPLVRQLLCRSRGRGCVAPCTCRASARGREWGVVGLSMCGLGVPHGFKCACVCDSPSTPQLSSLRAAQYLSMRSARLSPFPSAESMTAGATPRSSAVIALPLLSRRLMLRPVREARGSVCLPRDPGAPEPVHRRLDRVPTLQSKTPKMSARALRYFE
jgi:hypothetical protein